MYKMLQILTVCFHFNSAQSIFKFHFFKTLGNLEVIVFLSTFLTLNLTLLFSENTLYSLRL